MGKKRKIRVYPQKFGRKFTSHPVAASLANLDEVTKKAEADDIITEEEVAQIKQAKEEVVEALAVTAVEEVTEVIEKIEEVVKPLVKKVTKRKTFIKPRTTTRKKKTVKTVKTEG